MLDFNLVLQVEQKYCRPQTTYLHPSLFGAITSVCFSNLAVHIWLAFPVAGVHHIYPSLYPETGPELGTT